jgi:diguanylate cyclase (GGDEF)-like protein
MATADTHSFALDLAERLAALERLLADNPTCAVGVFDAARNIVDAGPAFARVGMSIDGHLSLKGGLLAEFLAVSDVWRLSDAALEAGVDGTAMRPVRLRDGRRADLHLIEIGDAEVTTVAILVPHDGSIGETPQATAVAAGPRVGVVRCDAFGLITNASDSMVALLGPPDTVIEGTPVVSLLHPEDREVAIANWSAAKEQRGVALRWRARIVRTDESLLWVDITITNEIDADGYGDVSLDIYDVSLEVAATDALVQRASTDELTGCLNRSGTIRALELALADLDPRDGVGLLFIDLNHFKGINDSRGHAIGDVVLAVVARRLHGAVRTGDLVGRLGGDEFVVIAPGLHSADATLELATRIAYQLQGPATVEGVAVPIAASIGVAWTSTTSAGELLRAADTAMYTAKETHSAVPVLSATGLA